MVTFLAWASDPKMEERKRMGFGVMIFLVVLSGCCSCYRKVWKDLTELSAGETLDSS